MSDDRSKRDQARDRYEADREETKTATESSPRENAAVRTGKPKG